MQKKVLLTSGCSFTEPTFSWASYLASALNLELVNYAKASRGNSYISRSIIYGVQKQLKTHKPEEILVGIMWSSADRYDMFLPSVDETLIDNKSNYNPYKFIPDSKPNWVGFNPYWSDITSTTFYKHFYDYLGSFIYTLEHILRTQWYLEKYNINYFMTTISHTTLPEGSNKDHNDILHLYNLLNLSKFVNVKSCIDWCYNSSGIPFNDEKEIGGLHPLAEHHRDFTNKVLVPFINNNIYPCKEGERK